MSTFEMYEVGGCVRDSLLGLRTKDIDYTVVADEDQFATAQTAYEAFATHLRANGFVVFLEQPEYMTVRARFPKGHEHERITADFVLARKEADYFDGRRPSSVAIGTLEDDLRRRDFTVNALARGEDGVIIDLFGGQADLERKILRCVGSPRDRFTEDALRALRALRFRITKGLQWSDSIRGALMSDWLPPLLASVSTERIREELIRCFRFDTLLTLDILHYEVSTDFRDACFVGGLWLKPSLED